MKLNSFLFLFFLLLLFVLLLTDAKKHGIKKIKVHKPKIKTHKPKIKIHKPKIKKSHVHHAGLHHHTKHHKKHSHKVIQSTTPVPLYSPPFNGTDNAQIPIDSQVVLILDWLSKVGATVDVFLRLKDTHPDGSTEQRQLIKNVYPPLRILLEAHYAHEHSTTTP